MAMERFERHFSIAWASMILVFILYLIWRDRPLADPNFYLWIRILLSFAVAVLGATIPGFLHVKWSGAGLAVRAAGALGLFVITFFGSPKVLPPQSTGERVNRDLGLLRDFESNLQKAKKGSERVELARKFLLDSFSEKPVIGNYNWTDIGLVREGAIVVLSFYSEPDRKSSLVALDVEHPNGRLSRLYKSTCVKLPVLVDGTSCTRIRSQGNSNEFVIIDNKEGGISTGIVFVNTRIIPIREQIAYGYFDYTSYEYISLFDPLNNPEVTYHLKDVVDFSSSSPTITLTGVVYRSVYTEGEESEITNAARLPLMRFVWTENEFGGYVQDQGPLLHQWLSTTFGILPTGAWKSNPIEIQEIISSPGKK